MYIIKCFIRSLLLAFKVRKFFPYYIQGLILGIFCRSYKYKTGEETFGRTPLAVFDTMAKYLHKGERFCDLGSGDGLGIFYINAKYNNPCIGIELIKDHYINAEFIKSKGGFDNCHFYLADVKENILDSEVYYLTATCFEEKSLSEIVKHLQMAKPRLIYSLSTSLTHYGLNGYSCSKKEVSMPWGRAILYRHERV